MDIEKALLKLGFKEIDGTDDHYYVLHIGNVFISCHRPFEELEID